jgi:peptidoglycan hydrolase CwlO-like protein
MVLCVIAAVGCLAVGCVSQRTYEKVKAETLEQTQALEAVRADVRELDREIAEWQASNRREDAAVSELRAAIQQEEEQLPIMRQRAEDTLALLKTQVATLMNQSWHLARKIVDMRQESASLQAEVAQYKADLEKARSSMPVASDPDKPAVNQVAITEAHAASPLASPNAAATESAPATPSASPVTPSVATPSVSVDPPAASPSWIEIITGWFAKIWSWLFG